MDSIESYLRKLIVASVGAADLGCEKLGKLLDECVARGEVTVEKGRVLNEELKRTCKQAAARDADEKPAVDVDAMSADSETPVFHMPAPYLYDANGRYNDEIQVKLTQQAAGAYELTYLLPQEWMNAAERAYPVVLDPIVEADLRAKNI